MAATVSSPWGKPGAWALDAEEHEDELKQERLDSQQDKESDFPSLSVAATKQPKKKKNQTLSLAEFATYSSAAASQQPSQHSRGLTHEDLLNLPTGPRQRSAEELDRSRLGGGFKSYGMNSRNGDDAGNSRWGGGGNSRVSSRDRDSSRELVLSRADEIDDWSKTKKSPSFGNERRERSSSFFDSQSKADESDSWVANKPMETRRFGGGGGGGGSNGGFERRGSFDSLSRDRYGSSNGGGAADSDNWGRKKEDSNGMGSVSGIARPKLVLQPRSLPISNDNGVGMKPKGSSPFGNARPREEVLAEKGKDWKEIDEKLESVKINNNNKEVEKGERGNAASFGRWSFGNGHGGSGNEPRTWRKPDGADSNSRPESAAGSENGHASEDGRITEDEHPAAN
ncbi:eukaryotic translation initiation factor 4B3 [Ricinus communis]|uniref:Translation initiation factor, putative n=1 Tax=Ricinus communis TaxID=3988 RepID=B9SQJ2_RICCO|nr:eukaryotic translation initiation factor 4B3 [Ricinus communis]EEF34099.1 translation initiation factor, putative [Ricinus communis]|eukprot:XP_002528261.1 eukaryotic translation initiation factor 4B3 [Ricinus communis]